MPRNTTKFKELSDLAREEGGVPCKVCRSLFTVNGGLICSRCLWLVNIPPPTHRPKTFTGTLSNRRPQREPPGFE